MIGSLYLVRLVVVPLLLACAAAQASAPTEPRMQFLGVGGYLIHWRGEGLLIAPLFSHPQLIHYPPFRVKADIARIDSMMPQSNDVTMLLIGHGHYDHLLDVPRIMQKQAPNAIAYGSTTVGHILRAVIPPCRIINVQSFMAVVEQGRPPDHGYWFYSRGGGYRAMPIESMHAPHFAGLTLAAGEYHEDLNALPTSVWGWKQGQVLAWLIDLLDDKSRPVFRIHYLDSASSPPYGLPPRHINDKRVDVQILAVSSWRKVDFYPRILLTYTRPRLVVLGHWENFFDEQAIPATLMPFQDIDGMREKVQASARGAPVVIPLPLDFLPLPPIDAKTH